MRKRKYDKIREQFNRLKNVLRQVVELPLNWIVFKTALCYFYVGNDIRITHLTMHSRHAIVALRYYLSFVLL